MAWQRNYVTLPTGERIRYSLFKRPDADVYFVRFRDGKKRPELSTGVSKKPDAMDAAHRLILEAFGHAESATEHVTWEVARAKLRAAMTAGNKRPKTIKGYEETLDKLIAVLPRAKGPGDVTEKTADEFKTVYATTAFTRKTKLAEGEEAPSYGRTPRSLDSRLRTLKAVFGWFKSLGFVESNPFENVEPPELDRHEVKYVKQGDVTDFFTWLAERFPGWAMPRLFFSVKAVTACRLEDICGLKSGQLQDGRLVFTADQTKNRSERYAILPEDLYAALDAYKGETYLWEKYPPELIEANKKKGWPTHRQKAGFDPRRLYNWVVQIMQGYQHDTGKDLSSHDFRKAAFTRSAEKDVHPKRAAVAFDVTAETMLRYYTATEKKKTADDVLSGLAGDLLPKSK